MFNASFNLSLLGNNFSILQKVSVEENSSDVLSTTKNFVRKEEKVKVQNHFRR